jgi:glutamate N-acetyltransferase/amino-acid N-acetyltransferase
MMNDLLLPKGFQAAGVNCGVRKYRPDIGLIFSETNCVAAGLYTKNSYKSSHIIYDQKILPSTEVRAIIVNSGHANAGTGKEGDQDNLAMAARAAQGLNIRSEQVLTSSTGVIGVRMPLETVLPGIDQATRSLQPNMNRFALAIMTTDLVPKAFSKEVQLSGGTVTITGAAKGSGMIHPNMGTMLAFVLTDAQISVDFLNIAIVNCTEETFNMISVDGETSTNDSIFILANGASQVTAESEADRQLLLAGLQDICRQLAISIAKDGEGASKLITVEVKNAPDLLEARQAARALTPSPLIKSAIHGEDPNWGRILARLGFSGLRRHLFERLDIHLQGVTVFSKGRPQAFDRALAREKLKADRIQVEIDLGGGPYTATAWGCDLTKRYVEINTEYS